MSWYGTGSVLYNPSMWRTGKNGEARLEQPTVEMLVKPSKVTFSLLYGLHTQEVRV